MTGSGNDLTDRRGSHYFLAIDLDAYSSYRFYNFYEDFELNCVRTVGRWLFLSYSFHCEVWTSGLSCVTRRAAALYVACSKFKLSKLSSRRLSLFHCLRNLMFVSLALYCLLSHSPGISLTVDCCCTVSIKVSPHNWRKNTYLFGLPLPRNLDEFTFVCTVF